jgi:hypothetical protein
MSNNYIRQYTQPEILVTRLRESWTHYFVQKITKNILVELMTFWLWLTKILSHKELYQTLSIGDTGLALLIV